MVLGMREGSMFTIKLQEEDILKSTLAVRKAEVSRRREIKRDLAILGKSDPFEISVLRPKDPTEMSADYFVPTYHGLPLKPSISIP